MSKQNRKIFEDYPEESYFKSNERGLKFFKELEQLPNALGFDELTNGYFVIHKKHKRGGFQDEVAACIILKNLGFGVELIEEYENEKSSDAKIEGKIFEIKMLKNAENINRAISRHFQRTYTKTGNIILHIVQKVTESQLKSALKEASEYYPSIKRVWLVYKENLIQLDRKMILSKNYMP